MLPMNKILYSRICYLVFTLAAAFIMLPGCKKERANAPVLTGVRNYAPAPGDSVLQSLVPGQWVVLSGSNLSNAIQISFDGIPATFNSTLFSDTSAVVLVPAVIPFPSVPAEKLNTIYYVTPEGATTFTFDIVAPPPTISGVSNENANTGDSVYISGFNFFFIQQLTFAGTPVTAYKASGDGTFVGFVLPTLTQSGPVIIATKSGADTTAYNVNNASTESLCNFDNVNTFSWGTNTDNSSANFPGNQGNYAVLSNGELPPGDGTWWGWQRSINTNDVQWLPVSKLGDPLANYALKFEISIPAEYNGTSIYVIKGYSWTFMARYEPWKDANGVAFPFATKGWRTVTIPLSEFRKDNGKGVSASSLTELLGSMGTGAVNIHTQNFANAPTPTGLNAAIDNIRVVSIK
jgi:hypothetical protein